jgi:hypothetical protein
MLIFIVSDDEDEDSEEEERAAVGDLIDHHPHQPLAGESGSSESTSPTSASSTESRDSLEAKWPSSFTGFVPLVPSSSAESRVSCFSQQLAHSGPAIHQSPDFCSLFGDPAAGQFSLNFDLFPAPQEDDQGTGREALIAPFQNLSSSNSAIENAHNIPVDRKKDSAVTFNDYSTNQHREHSSTVAKAVTNVLESSSEENSAAHKPLQASLSSNTTENSLSQQLSTNEKSFALQNVTENHNGGSHEEQIVTKDNQGSQNEPESVKQDERAAEKPEDSSRAPTSPQNFGELIKESIVETVSA